ncbi:hypothetical protein BX600DRAFT_243579 [Xylariales sp. PMI_506]|nr:hypothetical protein BX600DRAFT_243579 [Xylariales sp. PMI_506]
MAAIPQAFYCLWQDENIREKLFELLRKEDISNVRLASSACCNLVTKRLFLRTHLTFNANTFTKQSRVQALSRIGHHIEHLTFYFPHSDATFLPPLIHPETGREISFLYKPHTSMASVLERPKFANGELGEILTQQYPPLFHAASNVPSFIHAMKHLPNMRHLTIKTPGQDSKERYRRDIVDYALISLRVSLERAPLKKLKKLSLSSVHPSAFIYLRHVPGFGCMPSASRRWKQIRKLQISVDSWDFYGSSPGLDHLKIIDDYIRNFSECLEKFTFTWLGRKGPCPLSLAADPLFAPPRSSQKLFNEVTSPMSPLPPAPARKPIKFAKLRYMAVRNATMNAPQVAALVADHQHSVREFDFENVVLISNGNWDEALAPLTEQSSRSEHWSRYSTGTISDVGSVHSAQTLDDVTSPSAAVAAVSHELMGLDLGDDVVEHREHQNDEEVDYELPSDLEAARQASVSFPNKLKKRRITKRRRRRKPSHEHREERDGHGVENEEPQQTGSPRQRQRHRRHREGESMQQQSHHDLEPRFSMVEPPRPLHYRSRSILFGEMNNTPAPTAPNHLLFGELVSNKGSSSSSSSIISNGGSIVRSGLSSQHRLFGEISEAPELSHSPTRSPVDERRSLDDDDLYDDYFRPRTPVSEIEISAPILSSQPSMPILLQPAVYDPTAALCSEITAVQRDIEAEETQRMLAEDVAMRTSALKKAKEVVLSKLAEQFSGAGGGGSVVGAGGAHHGHSYGFGRRGPRKDSGVGLPPMGMGARLREGLFGRSTPVVSALDHRSMDVPILFSR